MRTKFQQLVSFFFFQECCPTRSLFKYTDSPLILPFENASLHLGARDKACWKRLNGVNLIQGISYTLVLNMHKHDVCVLCVCVCVVCVCVCLCVRVRAAS